MYIELFIAYLEKQKRYSAHTIKAYRNDLIQFQEYVNKNYPHINLSHIHPTIIRSWFSELAMSGISTRTLKRKKTVLQSFYKYLIKSNIAEKNPLFNVQNFKLSKNLPHFIQKDQMSFIASFPFKDISSFPTIRDMMIIKTLYATGMRVSEITNLRTDDLDEARRIVRVKGKRNKERFIPIHDSLIEEIKIYKQRKKDFFGEKQIPDWFFLTDKGQKVYPRMVYRIVSDFLSTYTKSTKKNPHVLRHTFATHLLQEGADLNSIKELLGHANLSATQIYTHTNITYLKQMYEKFHPKS
ncbi:MAG: tyrosine-type recombinase/integrase [Bacteroidales bacterium]|nr:tyrosine-type recombinase/integrase [Bacteroidales bacterium]